MSSHVRTPKHSGAPFTVRAACGSHSLIWTPWNATSPPPHLGCPQHAAPPLCPTLLPIYRQCERKTVVRLDCARCGRAGSYRRDGLVARFGPDAALPDVLMALATCERRRAQTFKNGGLRHLCTEWLEDRGEYWDHEDIK